MNGKKTNQVYTQSYYKNHSNSDQQYDRDFYYKKFKDCNNEEEVYRYAKICLEKAENESKQKIAELQEKIKQLQGGEEEVYQTSPPREEFPQPPLSSSSHRPPSYSATSKRKPK